MEVTIHFVIRVCALYSPKSVPPAQALNRKIVRFVSNVLPFCFVGAIAARHQFKTKCSNSNMPHMLSCLYLFSSICSHLIAVGSYRNSNVSGNHGHFIFTFASCNSIVSLLLACKINCTFLMLFYVIKF